MPWWGVYVYCQRLWDRRRNNKYSPSSLFQFEPSRRFMLPATISLCVTLTTFSPTGRAERSVVGLVLALLPPSMCMPSFCASNSFSLSLASFSACYSFFLSLLSCMLFYMSLSFCAFSHIFLFLFAFNVGPSISSERWCSSSTLD